VVALASRLKKKRPSADFTVFKHVSGLALGFFSRRLADEVIDDPDINPEKNAMLDCSAIASNLP
jgi:hypothetical protein